MLGEDVTLSELSPIGHSALRATQKLRHLLTKLLHSRAHAILEIVSEVFRLDHLAVVQSVLQSVLQSMVQSVVRSVVQTSSANK